MATMIRHRRPLISLVVMLLCISLCGGCSGLKYHRIFMAGLGGAAVGAIIGHQSDECAAGAGVGAAVFAAGELLHQVDDLKERDVKKAAEEVAQGTDLLSPTYVGK
jgi:hypothetical protein